MKTNLIETPLPGLVMVEVEYPKDDRGFFMEPWNRKVFAEAGLDVDFVQEGHSGSTKDVLRGLHYQDMTAPMGKLVRCVVGKVLDVAVDLRVGSPTFGKYFKVELTAEDKNLIYVPVGFAHGFLVLSDYAEVLYKMSSYWTPNSENGIIWNDPDINIDWPTEAPILSEKDKLLPTLKEYLENPAFKFE
jgi:dTDP-4-dehydrorhamnose 3,5-epimerase